MTAPHGTRSRYNASKCRCEACKEANREYMREYDQITGRYFSHIPTVDPSRAIAHVEELRAQGMGLEAIAEAAGIQRVTVQMFVAGRRKGIEEDTERAILSVRPKPKRLDPTGSRRRVQALVAMGWGVREIAAQTGMTRDAVSRIASGATTMIYRTKAEAIAQAYEELSSKPGPSKESRRRALVKGWAPPLAWDEGAIDDPEARPEGVGQSGRQRLDLDEWLLMVQLGETPERAARKFGASLEAVTRQAHRKDRHDVLDRLAKVAA